MKAWQVASDFPRPEDSLLIYAETAGKARAMAIKNGTWDYESYTLIKATRLPCLDNLFDSPKVIRTNDDLPNNVKFYTEDYE